MQPAVVVLSRRPLRVPVQKECSPATCHGSLTGTPCVTNPNERRSRACSSAKAPPTLAGRGRGPAQSSSRSPANSRNAPGAPGPASALALPRREAMARFERHGSELAARPDVTLGPIADPEGSCGPRPRGDRSWRCNTAQLRVRPGPVAVDALLREMHADPRVHCTLSWRRPTLGTNQTQRPHLTESGARASHCACGAWMCHTSSRLM